MAILHETVETPSAGMAFGAGQDVFAEDIPRETARKIVVKRFHNVGEGVNFLFGHYYF
jgi:hypothetical protein